MGATGLERFREPLEHLTRHPVEWWPGSPLGFGRLEKCARHRVGLLPALAAAQDPLAESGFVHFYNSSLMKRWRPFTRRRRSSGLGRRL